MASHIFNKFAETKKYASLATQTQRIEAKPTPTWIGILAKKIIVFKQTERGY
jgi:hypothetical protein